MWSLFASVYSYIGILVHRCFSKIKWHCFPNGSFISFCECVTQVCYGWYFVLPFVTEHNELLWIRSLFCKISLIIHIVDCDCSWFVSSVTLNISRWSPYGVLQKMFNIRSLPMYLIVAHISSAPATSKLSRYCYYFVLWKGVKNSCFCKEHWAGNLVHAGVMRN